MIRSVPCIICRCFA